MFAQKGDWKYFFDDVFSLSFGRIERERETKQYKSPRKRDGLREKEGEEEEEEEENRNSNFPVISLSYIHTNKGCSD